MSDVAPKRVIGKVLIRIVAILIALSAVGVFIVRPKLLSLQKVNRTADGLDARAAALRKTKDRVDQFHEKDEADVKRREDELREVVPLKGGAGVSDIITEAATASDLRVVSWRALDPVVERESAADGSGDRFFHVPMEVEMQGRYGKLPDFFDRVARGKRAIRVEGFGIARDESIFPDVKIHVALRTYFVEPGESEKGGG